MFISTYIVFTRIYKVSFLNIKCPYTDKQSSLSIKIVNYNRKMFASIKADFAFRLTCSNERGRIR